MRPKYAFALKLVLTLAGAWGALLVLAAPASAHALATFRDCDQCPLMVQAPAGRFAMGVSSDVEERHAFPTAMRGSGLPIREVTIARAFAIAQSPITVAEFRAFVQETGYDAGRSCTTQYRLDGHMIYEEARGYSWRDPGFAQTDDHPVVCVSWYDAMAYAEWLGRKTGHAYSLPNEAEYEYASRAGTSTDFFWGNDRAQNDDVACQFANLPDLDQGHAMGDVPMGWSHRFQCSDGWAYTSPVRTYRPNPWGLHDMLGNIWEWVEDCWSPNHADAPTDGSTRRTGDCDAHGSMGGSFGNASFSAFAGMRAPRDAEYRGHSWGFRVVRRPPG